MITFDRILPEIRKILDAQGENLRKLGPVVINRDLNGRIRLVLDEERESNVEVKTAIHDIVSVMVGRLAPHVFPVERMVFFEPSLEAVKQGAPHFLLEGFDQVSVVDRMVTETDWGNIVPIVAGAPRFVFFSIKGGVGRSTALAATAWSLAQEGKRVLVLDLDLESPGLSSSLLSEERRPVYGITDWLVEDLVGNASALLADMFLRSDISHDGEIYVVPAHGRDPGEYVVKLGRVWMSKVEADGSREFWHERLSRLLRDLEQKLRPDVILIDSRAGIDEVASACITALGAQLVLLFGIDSEQTWSGYRILFRHWRRMGVTGDVRDRLQLIGAMIPEIERPEYFDSLCEHSWTIFAEELYEEIPAGEAGVGHFNFDKLDESAPHYPWPVYWNRGFAALQSVHSRFQRIDADEVKAVFGPLVDGIHAVISEVQGEYHA